MTKGRVKSLKRFANGNPIRLANANPIPNSCKYVVEFDDGDKTTVNANLIAEAMYAQCDPDGNQYVLLDSLIDRWRLDKAIQPANQKIVHSDGHTYMHRSTIGWQLCCQWKDSSTSWENLSDLKESHPLETAKYAMTFGIDHEPAFNWWVPHVLKKRNRIIFLVWKRKIRHLKRTHKVGIEVPKPVKEAFDLDRKNCNTFWANAIATKMKEVWIAFKIVPDRHVALIGYQKIPCQWFLTSRWKTFDKKPDSLP